MPGPHGERDVVDGDHVAVSLGQVFYVDHQNPSSLRT